MYGMVKNTIPFSTGGHRGPPLQLYNLRCFYVGNDLCVVPKTREGTEVSALASVGASASQRCPLDTRTPYNYSLFTIHHSLKKHPHPRVLFKLKFGIVDLFSGKAFGELN